MALFIKKAVVAGILVRDIKVQMFNTRKGITAKGEFTLAVQDDKDKNKTFWATCTVWGKTAEAIQKYCGKGSCLYVEGKIAADEWKDKTTGATRVKWRIEASLVRFITMVKESENTNSNYSPESEKYAPPMMDNTNSNVSTEETQNDAENLDDMPF